MAAKLPEKKIPERNTRFLLPRGQHTFDSSERDDALGEGGITVAHPSQRPIRLLLDALELGDRVEQLVTATHYSVKHTKQE
jgi:hypothetical protein